jgi:hypothetical protein
LFTAKFMLATYRIIYGVVAGLLFVNFLTTHYYGAVPHSLIWLVLACRLSLVAIVMAVILFLHVRPVVIWAIVLVWEALFVWYAWLSPGAPFAMYSDHTRTTVLFSALFLWFLSLPVIRSVRSRRDRISS